LCNNIKLHNNNNNNNNNNDKRQKYMIQETAAQNIKNQLKSRIENKKIEELKGKPMHSHFYWDLERPPVDKEISWCGYAAQT
jgi:hypothetical protein